MEEQQKRESLIAVIHKMSPYQHYSNVPQLQSGVWLCSKILFLTQFK